MCYHNSINTDTQNLERKYKKRLKDQAVFKPVFHASGFEFLQWPIITPKGENIELMNWGLIPNWVNTPTAAREIKSKTLNARIETVDEKPSFRNAQRCIIPSTGFFEWQTVGKEKMPRRYKIACCFSVSTVPVKLNGNTSAGCIKCVFKK